MKNERIPEPCISIFAVSKQQGFIPTSAYARQARCYVFLEPSVWCSFSDPKGLAQIFKDIASKPVPEVPLTFEEVKNTGTVSAALGDTKTVSIDVEVLPESYHLRILRNNAKGEWLGEPCALELDFKPEGGFEPVALAIVEHLRSRKDLPEEANLPSTSVAQGRNKNPGCLH